MDKITNLEQENPNIRESRGDMEAHLADYKAQLANRDAKIESLMKRLKI